MNLPQGDQYLAVYELGLLVAAVNSSDSGVDAMVLTCVKAMKTAIMESREPNLDRSLCMTLNVISLFISELPLDIEMCTLGEEEEKFLEHRQDVRRINHIYSSVLKEFSHNFVDHIKENDQSNIGNFRNYAETPRNKVICFYMQLFGTPLAILNLSDPTKPDNKEYGQRVVNSFTRLLVTRLVGLLRRLFENPFQIINIGQRRALHPYQYPKIPTLKQHKNVELNLDAILKEPDEDLDTEETLDIFLPDGRVPLLSLSVLFYALMVENLFEAHRMKIYNNVYLFETGLYYVTELLANHEHSLVTKGLRLGLYLLGNLQDELLEDDTLELDIHKKFSVNLMRVLDNTTERRNVAMGLRLMSEYVRQFKTIGARYFLIQYLMKRSHHSQVRPDLIRLYKNILEYEISRVDQGITPDVSPFCRGSRLMWIWHKRISTVNGDKTMLPFNNTVFTALNFLLFILLRDKHNYTEIWNHIDSIKSEFLYLVINSVKYSRQLHNEEEDEVRKDSNVDKMKAEEHLSVIANSRLQLDLVDNMVQQNLEAIRNYQENANREENGI